MTARNGAAMARLGKATEREACELLGELTGHVVRRKASEGIREDHGDLIGLPDTTVQVSRVRNDYSEIWQRAKAKVAACEQQQQVAGTRHGVTLLRINRGPWVALCGARQFAMLRWPNAIPDRRARPPGRLIASELLPAVGQFIALPEGIYAASPGVWARLWARS